MSGTSGVVLCGCQSQGEIGPPIFWRWTVVDHDVPRIALPNANVDAVKQHPASELDGLYFGRIDIRKLCTGGVGESSSV